MDSATPLIEALAWTLIHFLWEGTVLAAVLWLVLRGMRQATAVWRYAAAALVMAAMLVAAAATLVWQWPAVSDRAASPPAGGIPAWVTAPKTEGKMESPPASLAGAPGDDTVRPDEPSSPDIVTRSVPTASAGLAIRPWLPWIVGGWAAGVLAVLGRLAHGWWWLRRVRLGALGVGTGRWNERLREIARALRVDRPVRLLSSVTARVPMVVGWLKPVVIVPAALFAGLPAAQLEAILAHELAHIRRNDFLVNLLQCLVEALLFYHPAVWWVSGQVRKEREHCCDDIAASLCGGALPYARALTALEEFRGEEPVLGLAASGGLLVQRIRRLLGVRDEGTAGWPVVVAVLTLALLPLGMVLGGAKPAFVAPQAAHIGDGVWSSYCVHAGGETQFVFLTKGDFSSSTRSHHNAVARTWKDEGTLRFPDGREVSFRRSSETPDTLVVEDSQPTARFQWEAAAPTSPILGAVEGSGFHSRLVMPLPLLGLGQEEVKVEKNRISYTLSLTKGRVLLLDEVPAGLHLLNVPVKPISSAESLAAARSLVESASAAKATAHPGIWVFPGGVTLRLYGEVVHATDVMTTALITWPGREGQGPAQWHTGIAGDAFANREKWAVGWEKDTPVLWVASRSLGSAEQAPDGRPVANRYKRIDFSDPSHIREDSFQEGWPEADGPSASVVTQLSAFLEVRAGGKSASTLHSWASAGTAERIDLSAVQNILITTAEDETISVEVQELKRTCRPEALAETLAALRAEWTAKRGAPLAGKSLMPRVTVTLPPGAAPAALEAIRAACVEAGCGPWAAGSGRSTGGARRFESARYDATSADPPTPSGPKIVKIKSTQLALGPPRADGLRVAWVLDPARSEYQVGEIVKGAVWFYNDGPAAITFTTDAWHQFDTWKVTRADGSAVEVRTTWFTGITPQETITLQPGEAREIPAHGVGIGKAEFAERYGRAELGAELWAEPGDEVTCVWEVAVSPSSPERLTTGPVTFRITPAPPALSEEEAVRLATEAAVGFFKTDDLESRLQALDVADDERDAVAAFLQRHPLAADPSATVVEGPQGEPDFVIAYRGPDGGWKVKVAIETPKSGLMHFFLVNVTGREARLHWESSTMRQVGLAEDIAAGQAGETHTLWATVKRGDYFNRAYSDESRFSCYELSVPRVERRFFGYVAKGSSLDQALVAALGPGEVSLTTPLVVTIPQADRDERQLEIVAAPEAEAALRSTVAAAPVTGFGIRLVSDEAGPTTERLPEKAASGGTDTFRHVEKDIVISTVDVASAAAEAPSAGRTAWSILVELTPAAGQRFEEFTGRHLGRRLAIVVDGVVLMSPTVRARIGRSIAISGNFSEAEAKRVAQAIQPTQEGKPGSAPGPAPSKADAPESDGPAHRLKVVESQGLYPLRHFRVLAGVPSGVSSEFEKTHGVEVIIWQPHTLREGTNGELLWPLERSYEKMALRVEADGFVPQVFSWLEKANGAQEWTFQLVDDAGVRGTVMTPENRRPAHDATVVLAMVGRSARLKGSTFPELQINSNPASPREAWERPVVVTPDANGGFSLPTEIDPTAMVLFLHGDGVLEMPYTAWKAQPNVTLQRWGRVHGRVKWGDTAGAGEKVALSANHGDLYGYPDILSQSDETMANEDGVFVFQRVLPGLCQLSCPIIPKPGNAAGFTAINLDGRLTHTTVAPGPTITPVVIGGVGRSVTGRLSGRASYDGITLHLHPTAPHIGLPGDDEIWKAWNAFQASREGRLFFREGLKVAADGRFDIPAVLPGSYQMFFAAPGGEAVVASSNIIVPPEQRDHAPEPMDLGEIKARP